VLDDDGHLLRIFGLQVLRDAHAGRAGAGIGAAARRRAGSPSASAAAEAAPAAGGAAGAAAGGGVLKAGAWGVDGLSRGAVAAAGS